jgi:uncharacterized protein YbjT (DUF2867 family)
MRCLVTGATGYVGGRLVPRLLAAGHEVRCLTRDPRRLRDVPWAANVSVVAGDVAEDAGLPEALAGVDVAYYLVHSMGSGDDDFAETDRRAARTFGAAARDAGVARIVYLGGLEGRESEHLRSREEVAQILADHVPGTVHARAAMVIGARSTSFRMLSHLVDRLPVMLTPRWIDTRTQPIAIRDVVSALSALATFDDPPAEVQLGGADVLAYRDMMVRYARISGRREPRMVSVPVLTPRLSSYWVGLVTPVSPGVARPLVRGLSAEMLVRRPPPPGLNDRPLGFEAAVREALTEAAA